MFTRDEFSALATAAQHDPRPLIERAFRITTKGLPGQSLVAPLVFNPGQVRVHEKVMQMREAGMPPRLVVLKARQPGVSTLSCGYIAAALLTRPYAHAM